MEYELDINGRHVTAEVMPGKRGGARVVMDGKSNDLEYQRVSEACIQLTVNGRQVNAWVKPEKNGKTILLNGRHFFVKDLNPQDQAGTTSAVGDAGLPLAVTPPMPAIVIQVPVSVGDRVAKGDTVVVISAMKMETAIQAPYSGVITRIGVKEGDKVMPGNILADIDPENEDKSTQGVP